MNQTWQFFELHPTLLLMGGWLFSAIVSAMPPISDEAPYLIRWAHDALQLIAANINRKSVSSTTIQTPQGSLEKIQTEGSTLPSIPQPPKENT